MTPGSELAHEAPRSLIVTSNSHGELAHAMYFLRAQKLRVGARLLMPRSLFDLHGAGLGVSGAPYARLDDILGEVDSHRPELACLFSAYLFPFDGLLSAGAVASLRRRLAERGCRVITSDPFLGLAHDVTASQLDKDMLVPGESVWKRRLVALLLRLQRSKTKVLNVSNLSDAIHLYPTTIPKRDDGIVRVSFFNPEIVRANAGNIPLTDSRGGRASWLFVLSDSDLHVQLVRTGLSELIESLLGMLRHAEASDRQATLIAPLQIIERIANVVPSAELLPWRPLHDFERRVLDAEYVFYWNAFSFSQLARIANELPIFLFDRGHLARAIQPLYAVAQTCHLGDWEPKYLDQRQLFSDYVLAHLAKAQKPAMRALREKWEQSPTPDALVDQLLVKPAMAPPR